MNKYIKENYFFIIATIILSIYIFNTDIYFDAVHQNIQKGSMSFWEFFTSWNKSDTLNDFKLRFVNLSRVFISFLNYISFPFFPKMFTLMTLIGWWHVIKMFKDMNKEKNLCIDFFSGSLMLSSLSYGILKAQMTYSLFFAFSYLFFLEKDIKKLNLKAITVLFFPNNTIYLIYNYGIFIVEKYFNNKITKDSLFYLSIITFIFTFSLLINQHGLFYTMVFASKLLGHYTTSEYLINISFILFLILSIKLFIYQHKNKTIELSSFVIATSVLILIINLNNEKNIEAFMSVLMRVHIFVILNVFILFYVFKYIKLIKKEIIVIAVINIISIGHVIKYPYVDLLTYENYQFILKKYSVNPENAFHFVKRGNDFKYIKDNSYMSIKEILKTEEYDNNSCLMSFYKNKIQKIKVEKIDPTIKENIVIDDKIFGEKKDIIIIMWNTEATCEKDLINISSI